MTPRTTDRSRDLLFGLIALQNGLVDQDQLVAAFHAWTRDKDRSSADLLLGHGVDHEQRALLEGLVAQHVKKHGGDAEKSLAAIPSGILERLVERNPSVIGLFSDLAGCYSGMGSLLTEVRRPRTATSMRCGPAVTSRSLSAA